MLLHTLMPNKWLLDAGIASPAPLAFNLSAGSAINLSAGSAFNLSAGSALLELDGCTVTVTCGNLNLFAAWVTSVNGSQAGGRVDASMVKGEVRSAGYSGVINERMNIAGHLTTRRLLLSYCEDQNDPYQIGC